MTTVGSKIPGRALSLNKACVFHIKRNRFWKPVSFDQKYGRWRNERTRRRPAEVSLSFLPFFSCRERHLLTGKESSFWYLQCTISLFTLRLLPSERFTWSLQVTSWCWNGKSKYRIDLIHNPRRPCMCLKTNGIKTTPRNFSWAQTSDKIPKCEKSRSSLCILD